MWHSILLAGSLAVANPAGPPPRPLVEVPAQFTCMTAPDSQTVVDAYDAYVATFTIDILSGGMDPEFRDLLRSEGARCAAVHGWDTAQTDLAMVYTAGTLVLTGSWNTADLTVEERDNLRAALEKLSPVELQLIVGFMQLSKTSPSAANIGKNMLADLLKDAGFNLEVEAPAEIGGVIAGLSMSSLAASKFTEITQAQSGQEGEE